MKSLSEGSDKGGLRGWFEGGGWDRYDSKGNKIGKCGGKKPGEAKPKCFSKEKAAALGKEGRAKAVKRKRREDPNPNRRGKPIDTPSTKKGLKRRKKRESMSNFTDSIVKKLQEKTKKDACYNKVKASAKVWPSAYASGRLVQCRKKGASNYGKSNSSTDIIGDAILEALKCWKGHRRVKGKTPGAPGSCKKIGEGYKVSPDQAEEMRASLAAAQAERRRHGAGNYRGSGAEGATTLAQEASGGRRNQTRRARPDSRRRAMGSQPEPPPVRPNDKD
jgi:hypothetical protein